MKAEKFAEKLARTAKAIKSEEREAEEQIASAAHESATYRELWDTEASATLQMLYVQERGFSNALGEISKHLKVFRDLRTSSASALPPSCLPNVDFQATSEPLDEVQLDLSLTLPPGSETSATPPLPSLNFVPFSAPVDALPPPCPPCFDFEATFEPLDEVQIDPLPTPPPGSETTATLILYVYMITFFVYCAGRVLRIINPQLAREDIQVLQIVLFFIAVLVMLIR